jgi:hypothetical protein
VVTSLNAARVSIDAARLVWRVASLSALIKASCNGGRNVDG